MSILRRLKTSSSKKAPPPLSPIDTELEKDESRATFLIAGYPRYKCPYVWLRSNHKRLIQNNNDQKVEANDPLKLSTISSWRTDGNGLLFLFSTIHIEFDMCTC